MKILITGASGFIGKNLVKQLKQNSNNEIYLIVISEQEKNELIKIFSNINIIVLNLEIPLKSINEIPENIDIFYHLAWIGTKPEDRKIYDIQFRNIAICNNCIQIAIKKHIKKFISLGSTNEYLFSGGLINKNTIPTPSDCYGSVKVASKYLLKQCLEDANISFIYVIITGIYSEFRKDNNVISYTINKLLNNESPSLTKLEQMWDYVHIDDVVEALELVGKYGKSDLTYAVGHGDNWQLKNYIEIIHNKINKSIPLGIGEVPYTSDKLPSSCIDLTDIMTDTGFKPKIDFETGITRVLKNWEKI